MTDPEQPRELDEHEREQLAASLFDVPLELVKAARPEVPPSDRTIRNIIARGQVIE